MPKCNHCIEHKACSWEAHTSYPCPEFKPAPPYFPIYITRRTCMWRNWGIQRWPGTKWCQPIYRNNTVVEFDFGKFSIFLGKGKNWRPL